MDVHTLVSSRSFTLIRHRGGVVLMRHHRYVEDTQPAPRVVRPAARQNRYPSCLLRLLRVLVLLGFLILVLSLGWYGLRRWFAALPRTNVLVLGLDRRPGEGNVVRSDTMVLATFYPPGPHVALLSIPRDLYVEIPGHGAGRINTAHFWGESESEGGGLALAVQTVAQNFNLPVHRHVRVDFDGFRVVVDAVGGIDVTVAEPIVDDAYPTEDYGTMHIEIAAGPQHMDGETALRYARSRHGSSDFDRLERQQQVLLSLARRLLEPQVWPRLPALYQALTGNVDTDMTVRDWVLFAFTLYRVGPDEVEHCVVDREMTDPWTTPDGGAVLLPRWEAIHPVVGELFAP